MKRFIVMSLLLVLAACARQREIPGQLVIGVESLPVTLDPRFAADAMSQTVCRLIYTPLFRRDARMRLIPMAAERLEQKDPVTYLITLRRGIQFHNGAQLAAEDVRYTIASIVAEGSVSPFKETLGPIASVEVLDPLTVVIRLREPFAPFAAGLTFGIVPTNADEGSAARPVGAGAFRFVSLRQGERLDLERNAGYFAGQPRIERIAFRAIPDETVRLLELKKRNIHLVTSPITPAVLPWLSGQKGLAVKSAPGTNVSYIGFNMRDPALADVRVRRAIAHAINRRAIVDHLLKGLGAETETLIAPPNPYHAEGLPRYEYSPGTAMRLLDEAGYPVRADGGPRLTLTFKTSKNPTRRTIAEVFAQDLAKVGIELKIKSVEWGAFFNDIRSGNFQMYSLTWVGVADPDILHFIFHSSSLPPAGGNRGALSSAALDHLLEEGRHANTPSGRITLYNEAQRIIAEELPYVILWTHNNVAAVDERLKGFELMPDESLDSLETARWEGK